MPQWWEDPDLATAVAEVEQFAADAGWDASPRLFALVPTVELRAAQPELAGHLAENGVLTPIAQDELPPGNMEKALASIVWPDSVAGCALVQEILVLPPDVAAELAEAADGTAAASAAAGHPRRTEARLVAGVLRGAIGGACLLRVRPSGSPDSGNDQQPLRGGELAPGLIAALQATFS
ncbi:MAG: PPA1309 family protein [Actinomycetota bacterium]|nr:PPA1309 family protein [Actinomycetota bacterium]